MEQVLTCNIGMLEHFTFSTVMFLGGKFLYNFFSFPGEVFLSKLGRSLKGLDLNSG